MDLLTTKRAAQILGISEDAVRWNGKQGRLLVITADRGAGRTQRLYVEADVQRFKRQRDEREAQRDATPVGDMA